MGRARSPRWVIIGNSGSGKTTLASEIARRQDVPVHALDDYVWEREMVRRETADSLARLDADLRDDKGWIVEGCYGEIARALAPRTNGLVFLDPGVDASVSRCRARPWEPSKFETPEAQDAHLEALIAWVREYPGRDGDLGRDSHLDLYEAFDGPKWHATATDADSESLAEAAIRRLTPEG